MQKRVCRTLFANLIKQAHLKHIDGVKDEWQLFHTGRIKLEASLPTSWIAIDGLLNVDSHGRVELLL